MSDRIVAGTKITSLIYDGGGAVNALQTDATAANVVASGAAVINVKANNIIDIWLMNSTAAQSCILKISEFSIDIPTVLTHIRDTEIAILVKENTSTVDRAIFGLGAGVEYKPKSPVRVVITPSAYVIITISASLGGVWYARYQLNGSA